MANKVENSSVSIGSGGGAGAQLTQQQIEQLLKLLPSAHSTSNKTSSYDIDEEIDYNFAGIAYCSCAKTTSAAWILDTGATDHMTPSNSKLHTCKLTQERSHIKLPNGNTASIAAIGNIRLAHDLVLNDTLLVPKFKFNLLSVSKLTRDNNCVAIFYPQVCLIQDCATKTLKAIGKEAGGLYHLLEVPAAHLSAEAIAICNNLVTSALPNYVSLPDSTVLTSAS